MKLTVFIPALNEAENIGKVIGSIPKNIEGIDEIKILVVDDGSTDQTGKTAKEAGAHVISHHTNLGVGAAFQTGLEWALENGSDLFANIDADGQFNPADLPLIVSPVVKGEADMSVANRFANGKPENMSRLKYWGNKRMNSLINFLTGGNYEDVSSGFRAYNREAMLSLNLIGKFTYTQEVFLDLTLKGLNIKSTPVDVKYYKERHSRVANNVVKYGLKTFWIIFRTFRDYRPLKFFGILGGVIFFIGLFFDTFIAVHYINKEVFSPYISVAFIGAYLNTIGLAIMFMGLIADMFDRVRRNQEKILYYQKKQYYKKNP